MNDLMTQSFTSYVDLKKAAMKDLDLEAGLPPGDLEMGSSTNNMDIDMGLFLEEAEKVKTEMASLRDMLARLQQANEESKSLHKPDALKSLRNRITSDITNVLKKARTIRAQLEEMDRANAANKRLSGLKKDGNPAIYRTRIAVTNGIRKKLKEIMMDFQGLRQKMMTEYKDTVGRRYFTVTGEYPEEEVIEKIISNGAEEFFGKAVQEHGRGKVLETVVEIQDRYDAAKEIEKNLLELHQVFLDMAVMVEAQGEKMDDIEHHVLHASHYVNDGTKNLQAAKQYQRGSRKWMCAGLILLLLIILVIVIPIITSFASS